MDKRDWSIKDWFRDCQKHHTENGEGETVHLEDDHFFDGRCTMTRIHHELVNVHTTTDADAFTDDEVQHIVHYMDPEFQDFITLLEAKDAFKRCKLTPDQLVVEYNCSVIMIKLEDWMVERKLRIIDLFRRLDTDHSNYISTSEFQKGVEKFIGLDKGVEEVKISMLLSNHDADVMLAVGGREVVAESFGEEGYENKSDSDDSVDSGWGGREGGGGRQMRKSNSVI